VEYTKGRHARSVTLKPTFLRSRLELVSKTNTRALDRFVPTAPTHDPKGDWSAAGVGLILEGEPLRFAADLPRFSGTLEIEGTQHPLIVHQDGKALLGLFVSDAEAFPLQVVLETADRMTLSSGKSTEELRRKGK
jgi:hypothetical protein